MESISVGQTLAGAGIAALIGVIVFFVLNIIANWKLLSKAGHGGWQSLIPVWNTIARYGVSWKKIIGVIVVLLGIVVGVFQSENLSETAKVVLDVVSAFAGVLAIIEKFKLSKAYGHGVFFGLGLVFLEPLFIMILAFGKSKYVRK